MVSYSDGQIAPQFPGRGEGAFYKLYADQKVGSMIAWAWGVSRIIDGLEKTPRGQNRPVAAGGDRLLIRRQD